MKKKERTAFESTTKDPYSDRRGDVLMAAANLYRVASEGGDLDFDDPKSKVNPIVGTSSDIKRELHAAEARAAELTISARTAVRIALEMDRLEQSRGLRKILPAIELLGARVFEPGEYSRATAEGGIVQTLRLQGTVDNLRRDI